VWVEGHLRPVLTDQVQDAVAGGDAGLGVGAVVRGGDLSVGMDGGVSLGVPVGDHQLKDLDPTRVDQQGGLFGVQRLWLGYDLGDHFGLLGNAGFALPIQSVRYNRRSEEVLGTWDVRFIDFTSASVADWVPRVVEVYKGQELQLRLTALTADTRADLESTKF
jgi:hypothetical protein